MTVDSGQWEVAVTVDSDSDSGCTVDSGSGIVTVAVDSGQSAVTMDSDRVTVPRQVAMAATAAVQGV